MKYGFIYKNWWKWLTLVILLYVFIAGFLVPLKPGILEVDTFQLNANDRTDISVETYNTNWSSGSKINAFLRYDSAHIWQFENVSIEGPTMLKLQGNPPGYSIGQQPANTNLIIHESSTGYLTLPSAFLISGATPTDNITWVSEMEPFGEWKWQFPFIPILYETVRNTFFHVAIWMAMFVLLIVSLIYSIKYLRNKDLTDDAVASSFAHVAVLWGMMGMITGCIWAKATWGTYWTNDPKLNMSAIAMMIYLAYSILRLSIPDQDRRAQLSGAYNIFAFVALIPLVFIIPRLTKSMHPGNGGNPALGGEDLDSTLRLIFYPAVIAYTLIGVWMSSILYRLRALEIRKLLSSLKS